MKEKKNVMFSLLEFKSLADGLYHGTVPRELLIVSR